MDYDEELRSAVKRRNRTTLIGQHSSHEQLQELLQQQTNSSLRYLSTNANHPEFRARVLQFLFRRFASWTAAENTNFLNRSSWRRACREMKFYTPRKFVQGDVEVVYADALLSSANVHSPKKIRPLLNYSQFVNALQLVATKIYSNNKYTHLDPRYIMLSEVQNAWAPFHQLFHKKLITFAIQCGVLDKTGQHTMCNL